MIHATRLNGKRRNQKFVARSAIIVWTAVSMSSLLGFTALAVDVGHTYRAKAELQRAVDSAAMAAASQITTGSVEAAYLAAQEFVQKNEIAGINPSLTESDVVMGHATIDDDGKATFTANTYPLDAVKVTVRMTKDSPNGPVPLYFGGLLGKPNVEMSASATAMLVPRDIAVVIDLSRSMDYDSQLRHESSTSINIKQVWEDLGAKQYGNMKTFTDSRTGMVYSTSDVTTIINNLGLKTVSYPYPVGSWTEYVNYVKGTSPSGAPTIPANYKNYYGLRTFVNYLLAARTLKTETPALANTRAQPMFAVKEAVEALCNYLIEMDSADHMSLHSYSDSGQTLCQLSSDLSIISATSYQQQAGGYGSNTNISSGIEKAILELTSSRARSCAKKVIFLLTDGNANKPTNETTGCQYTINSANNAVSHGIQINTISLGSEANQALMEQVAEIGKGKTFYVPTLDIAQYSDDLKEVFRTLGGKRPVRLIE